MNFNLNMLNNNNKKSSNPFGGIIIGIILLIAGTVLLWWNEGNNVRNIQTVKEISEVVIDVDSTKIDENNNGKLICTSGDIQISDESVVDPIFSVGVKTAKLTRVVEMYQWEEEEHDDDNSKSYTYTKKWSSNIIDSSNFHQSGHENNVSMPYSSESFYASEVSLGEFKLSQEQIQGLSTNSDLTLDSNMSLQEGYKVYDKYITNSEDMGNPNIGDIRISYEYNSYTKASILAVQQGNSFTNFVSSVGKTINRVEEGILSSKEIINKLIDENNMIKWGLRLGGTLLIIFGYIAVLSLISKIASFVPILGNIVGALLGLIAFLVGLVHSIIIIAIAWIRFRPVLGISLIVIAVALVFAITKLVKKNK